MEKRNSLRTNEQVKDAINTFMTTEFVRNAQGHCTKEDYFKVFIKIGTILRPNIEADDL